MIEFSNFGGPDLDVIEFSNFGGSDLDVIALRISGACESRMVLLHHQHCDTPNTDFRWASAGSSGGLTSSSWFG